MPVAFSNKNTLAKAVLVIVATAAAPQMHAGTIVLTLDSVFSAPDYAFYNYTDTSGAAQTNIPVAPYITNLNGPGYNNSLAYTFCYDFNSPTNVGTAYSGTFETFTDTATLEATYLVNELNSFGLINAPLAIRGAISTAIWEIMNPSSTTSLAQFPSDPAAQPYEAEAAAAVRNGAWRASDSARYPTWVPDNPAVQRFGVVFRGESPTPEPTTLLLLGLGLVGIGICGRRRRASELRLARSARAGASRRH